MLTSDDVQKLMQFLATKQDIQLVRDDVSALRESTQGLITAVDKLAGAIENLRLEYAAISSQLDRHEKWIKQIAEKAGVKLEY